MCFQCHMGLTDEMVTTQMRETLENPQFNEWNTTSVSHVAIASTGHNGEPARELGLNLLKQFIEWRRTMPDGYMPNSGMESMFTVYDLERIYKIADEKKMDELKKFEPIHKLKRRVFGKTTQNYTFYENWVIGIICCGILAHFIYKITN
jgi:hypothetical protein